jgi:DNA-binding GntR family transcriptional regulator
MKSNQTSIKRQIYNAILEDILSYEYRPNEILNEKQLVEKYGHSKTPVREALLSLCSDNVLKSIPRYGYEVVRLTIEDVRDMLQYRYIMESSLLSIRYKQFSDKQIEKLVEIDGKCTAAEKDIWTHWHFNSEFHIKMLAFCGNSYAVDELQKCLDRLKRAYVQFYWDNMETASFAVDTRNHSRIIKSLKDRELKDLLAALKDDLNDFSGLQHIFALDFEWAVPS